MSKVQVLKLAKEIGQKSKDVVDFLREQGFEVTNHLSVIDENEEKIVREKFAPDTVKKEAAPKAAPKPKAKPVSRKKPMAQSFDGRSPEAKAQARKAEAERAAKKGLSAGEAIGKKVKETAEKVSETVNEAVSAVKNKVEKPAAAEKESAEPQKAAEVSTPEVKEEPALSPEEAARRYAEKKARQAASAASAKGRTSSGNDRSGDRRGAGRNDRNGSGNSRNGRDGNRDQSGKNDGRSGSFQRGRGDHGTDGRKDGAAARPQRPNDGKPQNGRGTKHSEGGERFVTKATNNRERDKEREREKNRERERDDKNFGKHFDKNKVLNDLDGDEKAYHKKKDPNRKGAFIKPVVEPKKEEEEAIKNITIPETLTIKDLADKMKVQPSTIIKKLFLEGKMYTLTQDITYDEAADIALEFNVIADKEKPVDLVADLLKEDEEDPALMKKRPPVVCVMGHVDHGKTSLLDAIRSTNISDKEAGGITQKIGASVVEINGRKITFLDTPGHEAFTAMRLRGAMATDIAVLVVAADDGVMPQTVEAINHAKAAGVEIIVAVNKIDKPGANIDRVKQELTEYGLIAEDWGGSTSFVPVSAKTHEGIKDLLEMILLTADVNEYKANPDRDARGVVIEASLDKGRGPVATVLVQKGTLNVGDYIAIGSTHGKVRAMLDDKHKNVKSAGPSIPVEVLGLDAVPNSGDTMLTFKDEKEARNAANVFVTQDKAKLIAESRHQVSLEGLFDEMKHGDIKTLNVIIKADVQGSVEAIKQSLLKLNNDEVEINVIHGAVGTINESDVSLASASNAIVIGFNVRPDPVAKETADREKVDLRLYKVIYNIINDIEAAMNGMLEPVYEEQVIGHAEIRQTFKASGVGTIGGGFVLDGKIVRGCKARITRDKDQIFEGNLASLKRFKDDVKEVNAGYECGLVFEKFNDITEGDQVEFYQMVEVPRNKK